MDTSRTIQTRRPGFTLVELTIVILILAILAAIVMPKITESSDESRIAATATTVAGVNAKIQEVLAQQGDYPATVQASWFLSGKLPENAWALDYSGTTIWVDNTATLSQTHPALKHIRNLGTFWYNPSNGRFRALVPLQATDADTLDLYNACNASAATSINATTGG